VSTRENVLKPDVNVVDNIDDESQMKNLFIKSYWDRHKHDCINIDLTYHPNNFDYFLSNLSAVIKNTAQCDQLLTALVNDTFKIAKISDTKAYENKKIDLLKLLLNQYREKYSTMKYDPKIEDSLLIDYGSWRIAQLKDLLRLLKKDNRELIKPLKEILASIKKTHKEVIAGNRGQILVPEGINDPKISEPLGLSPNSTSFAEVAPVTNIEQPPLRVELLSYEKLPDNFKSYLRDSSKKTCNDWGISIEDYWKEMSETQKSEAWSTFNELKIIKSPPSVFSQYSMFQQKTRFEDLDTQQQQFFSEASEGFRHTLLMNMSASDFFNTMPQEIQDKIMVVVSEKISQSKHRL
jgi:hypothetical protein